MPVQGRAAATRQRIIDAAITLFYEHGYAQTGLNDIVDHAGVSMGAFYYHFGSKEAIGEAIIEQGWPKAAEVIESTVGRHDAGLEHVIEFTFAIVDLLKRDRAMWVANHLHQAFGYLSPEGREGFRQRTETFVREIGSCVRPGEVHDDLTADEVANTVYMAVHGCLLLSNALRDDVHARLVESWQILLRALMPRPARSYFREVVHRTASAYAVA